VAAHLLCGHGSRGGTLLLLCLRGSRIVPPVIAGSDVSPMSPCAFGQKGRNPMKELQQLVAVQSTGEVIPQGGFAFMHCRCFLDDAPTFILTSQPGPDLSSYVDP
jgi:hypothetical protein